MDIKFSNAPLSSSYRATILLALPLCMLLSGCIYTSEIARTRRAIEKETRADFDTGIEISMGPGLFRTAGRITRYVDDDDAQKVSRIAYGIRRIKAGVYPVSESPDPDSFDIPDMARFKNKGWKPALKVEDIDEVSWVMYRERNGAVNDLFVVVLTDDELVLARLQGQLDELLNTALIEVEHDGFQSFDFDIEDWF